MRPFVRREHRPKHGKVPIDASPEDNANCQPDDVLDRPSLEIPVKPVHTNCSAPVTPARRNQRLLGLSQWTTLATTLLASTAAFAQGSAVMTGSVVDAATKRPLADVVVTVTSPSLQGEQTVLTDASGLYRLPNLPPGTYRLQLEADSHRPYVRGGIDLHVASTARLNAELLPEGIRAPEVVVIGKAPTIDVSSSSTGIVINQDLASRLAWNPPGGRSQASRTFEGVAAIAPGAHVDMYGVSLAGTTSPENAYIIDGVNVNDPAFGILGTPLSIEFVKEVAVVTGGYLPEHGKAMGGILDVVTKSGSNDFHGSVFFNLTPGALEGRRTAVQSAASVITVNPTVGSLRDVGAEVGGPLIRDKLWFYAGVQIGLSRYNLERNLTQFDLSATGPQGGADAFPSTRPITCPAAQAPCEAGPDGRRLQASPVYFADEQTLQYIGKLTYLVNKNHHLTLSIYGTPTTSGGNGTYSLYNVQQAPGTPPTNLNGPYQAIGERYVASANDVSLKYQAAFNNKRQLLDLTLGWHHQRTANLPADGSAVGSQTGLARVSGIDYRRSPAHPLTDFERVPAGFCKPVVGGDSSVASSCPVAEYLGGGPWFLLDDAQLNSLQGRAVFTDLIEALGHHVVKAGVEASFGSYTHKKAFSGGDLYRESPDGTQFFDFRKYGFLSGPDQPVELNSYTARTTTLMTGGFLQDSWQILDRVTLNLGLRYDAQMIFGGDGALALTLPNQWSPRVGIIYDHTRQGRSKLFANFARYYEAVPLDIADRSFPSEPLLFSTHTASTCNPAIPANTAPGGSCRANENRVPGGSTNNPSALWARGGASTSAVDPNLSSQSSDELVFGAEYEVLPTTRLGVTFTHRFLNNAIEDMSRDEGNTYFIGNPGFGIARDFPKAVRNYDALTVHVQKAYAADWLFQASYTISRLYGNYSGLFRPETGQLDPNVTSDFDLRSLTANRLGPLPGDHPHQVKVFGAKDFQLPGGHDVLLGLTFRTRSGGPLNYLGSHVTYGSGEVFILPRGAEGRGDWIHSFDARVGYSLRLAQDSRLQLTMDVFNLFNFQGATDRDMNYTLVDVAPCTAPGAALRSCLKRSDGSAFNPGDVNPNFGKPTRYQDPRQFRFGAKVSF